MPQPSGKVGFAAFFKLWANRRGWTPPAFHWQMVDWLEHRQNDAVLMVFRGAAKSTLLAVYNAWRYYRDPRYRILHQGPDDGTAYKTSRDTQNVLRRHPLTANLLPPSANVEQWWVKGADDPRNASMYARGIMSNITSSRADEVQNDDVEVPRNIATVEAREKLRYRLGEQTHIAVPGARHLYVGTPHTHDSLYTERIEAGADALVIRLFEQEHRVESAKAGLQALPFRPEYLFLGIGKRARLLVEGKDYEINARGVMLHVGVGEVLDCYAGCAWPERFDRAELAKRRRECRTLNTWDSQYQLHAKPLTQVRLDPDRLNVYGDEPELREVNGTAFLLLGGARIMSATLRLDPSSGKVKSDTSALCLVLTDEQGNVYWHRAIGLDGELAKVDDAGVIQGGQVETICDVIERFHLGRIDVETNGSGTHVPSILRGALKRRRLQCAVREDAVSSNKNRDILAALQPPLMSGYLWAHTSVLEVVQEQMRSWNPAVREQPDDYLDAAARAILAEPARIGRVVPTGKSGGKPPAHRPQDWRPNGGVHEIELDLS